MESNFEIKDKTKPTEGIKVASFRKHIRKTSPHKHNSYFEIIYLCKGSGSHTIDTHIYEIKPPIVFTIRKEQLHCWDIKSEPDGFVLIIKKHFIDQCLDNEIRQLIAKLSTFTCLYPSSSSIDELFRLLTSECSSDSIPNRTVIDGLLKALLAKLLESAQTGVQKMSPPTNLFYQFKELLIQDKSLTNSVAHYAKLLHTSPQNLNAICRKETNQTAAQVLAEHILSEAKRYLLYTELSISEVCNSLGFKDNSHFTKYFKRHLGITPTAFRKGK